MLYKNKPNFPRTQLNVICGVVWGFTEQRPSEIAVTTLISGCFLIPYKDLYFREACQPTDGFLVRVEGSTHSPGRPQKRPRGSHTWPPALLGNKGTGATR